MDYNNQILLIKLIKLQRFLHDYTEYTNRIKQKINLNKSTENNSLYK